MTLAMIPFCNFASTWYGTTNKQDKVSKYYVSGAIESKESSDPRSCVTVSATAA